MHFSDTYYPQINGVTTAVETYMKELVLQGHKVLFIGPSQTFTETKKKAHGIQFYMARSIPFSIYTGFRLVLPNIFTMHRILKEFQPDIIHIHIPGVLGNLGKYFAKVFKIPVVATYHTLFSAATMYFSPRRMFNMYKLRHKGKTDTLGAKFAWNILTRFHNGCNLITAPTKVVAEAILKYGIVKPIVVVPNGLQISNFPPKKSLNETNKILHVGRLGYEKSVDILLYAYKQLQTSYPESELIIAGDGPARAYLEQVTRTLNLQDNVSFLGMVPHDQVPALYRSSSFFVTASAFETQGLVILEAMLSGLPVVAAAKWGPTELVTNGRNGYLFEAGNIDGCANAMKKLLDDKNKLKTLGKNARQFALQFDVPRVTKKLITVYQSLLNQSS